MRGIYAVAVRFECHPRCLERLRGPAQVARDECDLGLGDHAPRAGHRLFRTERTRSTSQESLCPNEIAELRHRDATQRERSEEHTSELQSPCNLVCRLLLEKKKKILHLARRYLVSHMR